MEEYNRIKISAICAKVCSGGTPKSTNASYYDGEIPWLNTKEVNFNRIYETEKCISVAGLENSSAKWIGVNSIVVAMYGATAGKSAIIKVPLTTNQACCNLTITKNKADYRFVYYALCNDYTRLASLANGGAQQNLNSQLIKDFDIPYPTLETQKQIASILSSLDDKIALNRRINDNLEKQAQALYKSWFVDFEPFKGGKFIVSELGRIPKGWRVGKLSDVGKIVGGSTPSKNNPEYYTSKGIAWLTPKDLSITHAKFTSRGEVDITKEAYQSCSTKLLPKGSVLFSSRAPIGYLSIASDKICTNQGFKSVIPNKGIGSPFIYYYLKTNTGEIESKASGSTFKEASGALMNSLPVVIPKLEPLYNFNEIVNPLFETQEKNEIENLKLSKLRDTLLPKLMSGELKISNLNS